MLVQLACLTACLVGLFSLLVQLLVSLCAGVALDWLATRQTRWRLRIKEVGASNAPEAARERCACQLAGAHAGLETKLFVSEMATGENAKTSKMSRQRLSACCTVRVHQ